MKLDTRDDLVKWLSVNYPGVLQSMVDTSHSFTGSPIHKFHGEGSIWTHTLMVMTIINEQKFEGEIDKQLLLTIALLHDIGKVSCRTVKNTDQPVNDWKYTFQGHEGASTFQSIDILNAMEKDDSFYSSDIKISILNIISRHGTHNFFTGHLKSLADDFRYADKKGAVRLIDESIYSQYPETKFSNRDSVEESKEIWFIVGLPGSGKSTLIEQEFDISYKVISRDEEMRSYYYDHVSGANGKETSNHIYAWINTSKRLKQFNAYLLDEVDKLRHYDKVVIDMTMLSMSKRRSYLNTFKYHTAHCIVLLSGNIKMNNVNNARAVKDAQIRPERFLELQKRFTIPIKAEGFQSIETYIV